jgi:tRNA(fMet)-specific endonuclease VapC
VRYLVDTDWVIHYLNGHAEIVSRIQEFGAQGLAVSFISLAELYEGVFYSRDPGKGEAGLRAFLRGVELLGLDETAELPRLERRSHGIADVAGALAP